MNRLHCFPTTVAQRWHKALRSVSGRDGARGTDGDLPQVDIRTRLRALRDGAPADLLGDVGFIAEIVRDDDESAELMLFGDERELAAYLSTLQGGDPFGRGPLEITWGAHYDRGESALELIETVRALVDDMRPATLH